MEDVRQADASLVAVVDPRDSAPLPDIYTASILVVTRERKPETAGTVDNINHFPARVKAFSKAEALGKLTLVGQRLFPGAKQVHINVADLDLDYVDDPEQAALQSA